MRNPLFQKRRKQPSSAASGPTYREVPSPGEDERPAAEYHSAAGGRETTLSSAFHSDESLLRLLAELDQNRKTARFSSGSKLVPLQTEAWDACQNMLHKLDPQLRDNLDSVYADIRVLNQLVWLSSEFHRSSREMVSQYGDLSLIIAKKLDQIVEGPHGPRPDLVPG